MSRMRTRWVGILNLTPDSFSDGGQYATPAQAMDAALRMAEQGAAIIDVGAESTRPNALPLTPDQEWQRLQPVLPPLCEALKGRALISLDTRHAETAARALDVGVDWINDVSGLTDPAMRKVLARSGCDIVAMHSLTIPADPAHVLAPEVDVVETLRAFCHRLRAEALESGIAPERIIFDPGIGFGKTAEQSLELLKSVPALQSFGFRLLIGHSRKSFLKPLTQDWLRERDAATLRISGDLLHLGVDYIRVHDVASHGKAYGY